MFGAPVAYIFQHLLGIGQTPDSAGYTDIIIEPMSVSLFGRMSGSMEIPAGRIAVSYENNNGSVTFTISIPADVSAVFRFGGKETTLQDGENIIEAII
jgi:hypothetical protein